MAGQHFLRSIATALFLLLNVLTVASKDTNEQQILLLKETVEQFSDAMREKDFRQVVKIIPPKVWGLIRDGAKVTDEQAVDSVVKIMEDLFTKVELVDFGMDTGDLKTAELPDGTLYAFIPSNSVVNMGEPSNLAISSHTLAIFEDGKWYMIDADDTAQRTMLMRAYPSFSGVEFPASKVEYVTE